MTAPAAEVVIRGAALFHATRTASDLQRAMWLAEEAHHLGRADDQRRELNAALDLAGNLQRVLLLLGATP